MALPRIAGLKHVRVITEPEAAAMHYSVERRLGEGEIVGVYDLGGNTFDATILRASQHAMDNLGMPDGVDQLGGIDFDDTLLALVDDKLSGVLQVSLLDLENPEKVQALLSAREACKAAKEQLSPTTETVVHLKLHGDTQNVTVSRDTIVPVGIMTVRGNHDSATKDRGIAQVPGGVGGSVSGTT
ncbi:Hsp70 family protein [Amycolatopsis antarctica]|uniref:Hsp70 family protein n=1 Tax=Amycolatopsis antarctica TaxID=1854586 RepID=UPI001F0A90A4|nr:Hsp70 family protein [Amycolatopsis antarctica]